MAHLVEGRQGDTRRHRPLLKERYKKKILQQKVSFKPGNTRKEEISHIPRHQKVGKHRFPCLLLVEDFGQVESPTRTTDFF